MGELGLFSGGLTDCLQDRERSRVAAPKGQRELPEKTNSFALCAERASGDH
jgi:hypothetical protein